MLQRRRERSSDADASSSDEEGDEEGFSSSSFPSFETGNGAQATRWIDPSCPDSLKSTGLLLLPLLLPLLLLLLLFPLGEKEGQQTLQTSTSRKTEPPATHHSVSFSAPLPPFPRVPLGRSAME